MDQFDFEHPVFRFDGRYAESLSTAEARFYASYAVDADLGARVIARFMDGTPAVLEGRSGSGRALLVASDLNTGWSDLALRSAFVPFMHRSVRYLHPSVTVAEGGHLAGKPIVRPMTGLRAESGLNLEYPSGRIETVNARAGRYGITVEVPDTKQPGVYALWDGDAVVQAFAVNPDTRESDLARFTSEEAAGLFGTGEDVILMDPADAPDVPRGGTFGAAGGYEIWKSLIVFAMALILAEYWLSASRTGRTGRTGRTERTGRSMDRRKRSQPMREMHEIPRNNRERALLVGMVPSKERVGEMEESLDELALLADTAGAEIVDRIIQVRQRHASGVLYRNRESPFDRRVVHGGRNRPRDFRRRPHPRAGQEPGPRHRTAHSGPQRTDTRYICLAAKSKQAKLQVELAQLQYMMPRLTRQWDHLSRQEGGVAAGSGGAIGVRGPGETQLEIDRRLIRGRITHLRRNLEQVAASYHRQRQRRSDMFCIALIGYTNAGKSRFSNGFTEAGTLIEDRLFATLDATTRVIT